MNPASDFAALLVTLKLASLTTPVLLLLGIPLAWWLARSPSPYVVVVEAVVTLPLFLPSTVLGFYLLLIFSADGFAGALWQLAGGGELLYSFSALYLATLLYSLPFVVYPLQQSFKQIDNHLLLVASTLGATFFYSFTHIVLPLARKGIILALVLAFTHTLGGFGLLLMIGGNIPGETQLLSMAIFDHVAQQRYGNAHLLALFLLFFTLMLLIPLYAFNRGLLQRWWVWR
ncbi:MAG: molybdate ABC transporter permease subunit [Gammaproteobacteria bacterium]|nr:molybdate ABC transporter permease subunit [Gammaproteobacteria bacterium]